MRREGRSINRKKIGAKAVSLGQTIFSFLSLLLLCGFWLAACSGGGGGGESSGTARVGLTIKVPSVEKASLVLNKNKSFAPAPVAIAAIGVTVVDPQGVSLTSQKVSVTPGEEVTITLDVPAGQGRTFTVQAFDGEGTVLFEGQASADLTAGVSSSIAIQMASVDHPAPVTLSISPTETSLLPGKTQLFTATLTGAADSELTWSVNDIPNGNATVGTITQANPATYTAPSTPPNGGTVTIKVASRSNPTLSATAAVTLLPPGSIQITVTPDRVFPGKSATLTATVSGLSDHTVKWSLVGTGSLGTITQSNPATYTAPATPPSQNPVTIRATSASDSTVFATAAVTVLSAPTITLSPTSASVVTGQTQTFTATVTGLSDASITWAVVGGAASGTITQSNPATYTAPAAVPNPNPVTVTATATSASDPTLSATASAKVTITTPQTTLFIDGESGVDQADCGTQAGPCKTITTALNKAKSGQTLSVAAGTYTFSATGAETAPLTMKSGVNIQGAGTATTVLSFAGTNDPERAGILGADNVTFSGFTIQDNDNLQFDISITSVSPTISDNLFGGNCDGPCRSTAVQVRGNGVPSLKNNKFGENLNSGFAVALLVTDTASPVISNNNHFIGNGTAIRTLLNAAPKIEGNTITGNRVGLSAEGTSNPDLGGGTKGSAGGNLLSCNTNADLITSVNLAARGNLWDHVPPKAGPLGNGIDLVSLNDATVNTVNATLATPPCSVKITAPANGAIVRGTVPISVTVSDPSGLAQVDYDLDGTLIGSGPPGGFGLQFNTTTSQFSEGAHTLNATSVNNARSTSDFDSIRITIDNTGPTVRITSPGAGALLGCGPVTVTASASDTNGIGQVEFFVSNGTTDQSIGVGTAGAGGAFTRSWTPGTNGSYTLTAAATDPAGNSVRSGGVTVRVSCVTTLQISPSTAVVPKGQTQSFSLSGATNADVVWRVNGIDGGNNVSGTISSAGVYRPPSKIPTNASGVPVSVTVEAVSLTNSNTSDTASVAVITGPVLKFNPNVPVNQPSEVISTASSGQRSIAFFNGTVEAVWVDGATVFFSQSKDGRTWSEPVPVASGNVAQPTLAVGPDGTIYVAYQLTFITGPAPIHTVQLSVRRPGGGFTSLFGSPNSSSAQDPTVAVSPEDGTVFLAWADILGQTGFDIWFQRIDKGGKPIDPAPRNLTEKSTDIQQTGPTLALGKSGAVFLAWVGQARQQSIKATASFDGGVTFADEIPVTDGLGPVAAPTLAADSDNNVVVAWEARANVDQQPFIFFDMAPKAASGNFQFGKDQPVGTFTSSSPSQTRPSIALDDHQGVYIALEEDLSGHDDNGIFLAEALLGEKFIITQVDDDATIIPNKSNPSLAVDSAGRAFAIWTDGRSNQGNQVFFANGE